MLKHVEPRFCENNICFCMGTHLMEIISPINEGHGLEINEKQI